VADNEVRQLLFLFPFDAERGELGTAERRALDLRPVLAAAGDAQISDIEAMARLSDGQILVYGSHSRNKRCARKKKRRRFVGIEILSSGTIGPRTALVQTPAHADLAAAFGGTQDETMQRVMEAIRRGEALADRGQCRQAFNIEGAVAVPTAQGDQVWVGLRAPLVDGHAVLLRHDFASPSLRFAEARLVDLGGAGIRALTAHDGWLWGISAQVGAQARAPYALWRFRASALDRAGPIAVERVGSLPNWSEGLAIDGRTLIAVSDGRAGVGRCERESGHVVRALPAP
jgi:hypothetical protein